MDENIRITLPLPPCGTGAGGDLDDLIFRDEGWLASDR